MPSVAIYSASSDPNQMRYIQELHCKLTNCKLRGTPSAEKIFIVGFGAGSVGSCHAGSWVPYFGMTVPTEHSSVCKGQAKPLRVTIGLSFRPPSGPFVQQRCIVMLQIKLFLLLCQ